MKNRFEPPIRFRRARANASLGTVQKTMAELMGLPPASIRLIYPSGRKAREDSTVAAFLRRWPSPE